MQNYIILSSNYKRQISVFFCDIIDLEVSWCCSMVYKKNKLYTFVVCLIGLLSTLFVNLSPEIYLKGENIIYMDVFSDYVEEGYIGTFLFKDITSKVTIDSNLNTSKVGKYNINYIIDYNNYKVRVKRTVNVVDREKPTIKLIGSEVASVCPLKKYIEEGYEVSDNYDLLTTENVEIIEEDASIIYSVMDKSGNKGNAKRKIIYEDAINPTISLYGESSKYIYVGSSYNEIGYSATDNCDGDITSNVLVSGNVDTNTVGSYKLTYTVTDSSGNSGSVDRIINVIPRENKVSGVGKKIYLTFDDGPSRTITPGILQILREENVKATFFVINKDDSLNYLIKQAHDEGHTIALHSYTHDYGYIYSSVDNYFNDLNSISNKVESIIGKKSYITRFPGGSSNTVSRRYQVGIMTTLANMVISNGYSYFDWNVDSCDAGSARDQYSVYNNVTNNLVYKNNIVLMHDFENNYKTLNALRDIIRYGKDNGYVFEALTINTVPSRHGINN